MRRVSYHNPTPYFSRIILHRHTQGWADTSLQPDVATPDIPTPNLKALMDSGVRLGNYYTQTVCSPTRSSLMTGRFPFRMGMQHMETIAPASLAHLPLTTPTVMLTWPGRRRGDEEIE